MPEPRPKVSASTRDVAIPIEAAIGEHLAGRTGGAVSLADVAIAYGSERAVRGVTFAIEGSVATSPTALCSRITRSS